MLFIYAGLSLLNQFFCDSAIIDKTLFYDICNSAAVGSAGFARPVQPIDVMWHSVALTGGQSLSLSK
jgi:hypothetical protein